MIAARTTPVTITKRPDIKFDFSGTPAIHTKDNGYLSHFWNTLSLIAPMTERALILTMRKAKKEVTDPRLLADIDAFIAQEGLHTREHRRLNDRLAALGHDPEEAIEDGNRRLDAYLERVDLETALAMTIAGEHLIYSMSHLFLADERLSKGMHREVKRLFEWHCLEEIEHQGVAHDVYLHLFGEGAHYQRLRVKALQDIAKLLGITGRRIFRDLLRCEPHLDRGQAVEFGKFLLVTPGYGRRMLTSSLRFLDPGFEPWKDPEDLAMIDRTLNAVRAA